MELFPWTQWNTQILRKEEKKNPKQLQSEMETEKPAVTESKSPTWAPSQQQAPRIEPGVPTFSCLIVTLR